MSRSWNESIWTRERTALSKPEATEFARQLTSLAEAGLPLPSGLRALSLEVPPGRLRRMLGDLASRLESGETLESALEAEGPRFPTPLRGLIVAGVRSGRLAESLGRFLQMGDLGNSLQSRLRTGLMYPALMFLVSFGLFVFVSRITTDGFRAIFDDFGVGLPWITSILLHASEGFSSLGWWVLIGPIVGFVVMWLAMRFTLGPVERGRLIHALPLIGPLARDTALAQFCPVLDMLLESGIPLPEALRLAADSSSDTAMADAARQAAIEVEEGHSLAEAVQGRKPFPKGFDVFLAWAEQNRGLNEALKLTAETFESRARARSVFISRFCNIVTMTAVIWWVSLTVLSLFLPLLSLLTLIAGPWPGAKANDEWPESLQMAGIGVVAILGVAAVFFLVWLVFFRPRRDPEATASRRKVHSRRFAHYAGMGWTLAGLSLVSLITIRLLTWLGGEWLPDWWKTESQPQIEILSIAIGGAGMIGVLFAFVANRVARRIVDKETQERQAIQGARIRVRPPTWRFGLRHMMFAMAPIALLMVLAREFGLSLLAALALLIPPLILVAGYLAFGDRRTLQREALLQVMAMAARDGRPLGPAILAFVPSCRGRFARRVEELGMRLERGDPLTVALNRTPKVLSRNGSVVAKVGWETGTLGRMLDDAVAASNAEKSARGTSTSTIAYSLVVMLAVCLLSAFLTWFVAPRFASIFKDMNAQNSADKTLTIEMADQSIVSGFDPRNPVSPVLLGGLILGGVIAAITLAVFLIRRFFDAVPLTDRFNRRGHSAVILRAHAAAIEAGQTVTSVLRRLAMSYPRWWVRHRIIQASRRVDRGEPWIESLRVEGLIGRSDAALLASAERVGNLPWALRQTADRGERRQTYRLLVLGQILQTVAIGGLGLVVFLFAFSYFRPLVIMIDAMTRII